MRRRKDSSETGGTTYNLKEILNRHFQGLDVNRTGLCLFQQSEKNKKGRNYYEIPAVLNGPGYRP